MMLKVIEMDKPTCANYYPQNGTKTTIQTIISLVSIVSVAVVVVTTILANIDKRLTTIEANVKDRWTATNMQVYTYELEKGNPPIKVPSVKDIIINDRR